MEQRENGQLMVIVALSMVVFMGFAALAVDLGNAYSQRRLAQNAADAGALYGLRFVRQQAASSSPFNGNAVFAQVRNEIVSKNGGADLESAEFLDNNNPPQSIGSVQGWGTNYDSVYGIRVKARIPYNTLFAGIMGIPGMVSAATATALSYEVSPTTGLLPIAYKAPSGCSTPFGLDTGDPIDIAIEQANPGNFGWVDFQNDNSGAAEMADWIRNSYSGPFNYFLNLESNPPEPPADKKGPPPVWVDPAHTPNKCDGYYQDGSGGPTSSWDVTPWGSNPNPARTGSSATGVPFPAIEWFGGSTGTSTTLVHAIEDRVPFDATILIYNDLDKPGSNARFRILGLVPVHLTAVIVGKDGKHLVGTVGGTTFGGVPTSALCDPTDLDVRCTVRLAPNQ